MTGTINPDLLIQSSLIMRDQEIFFETSYPCI